MQVVQPLRQRTVGPLGCGWGSEAQHTSLVSLCLVLVSTSKLPFDALQTVLNTVKVALHPLPKLEAVLCCAVYAVLYELCCVRLYELRCHVVL